MTNYLDLDIRAINELLKSKKIKPIDLVNEAFFKIEKNNLNTYITLNKEQALKKAKEIEDKEVDNLLFGIPIALKDNIITKDLKTTAASKMLENFIPTYDATVVKMINEKNMIIVGKTNMDEFAMGSTGETSYYKSVLNPWNKNKVPGGSSSGSAATVSASEVVLSLGSDTGGSVRQPSSFCGVVGMKPTYGRVSRYGLISFASSLDQIGTISKNVYDNALILSAISGKDDNDMTSFDLPTDFISNIDKDVSNMSVAVPNFYLSEQVDVEVKNIILKTIDVVKNMGIKVDYVDVKHLDYSVCLYQTIALAEASSNLARFDGIRYGYISEKFENLDELYKNTRTEGFGVEVKRRLMIGSYVLSGKNAHIYYDKALKVRSELTKSLKNVLSKYDLIIGPTSTNVAYDLNSDEKDYLTSFTDDLLTIPANMAGLPAMSMPVGFNDEKLPVGLHIISNSYKEDVIYNFAYKLEKKLNINNNLAGDSNV